MAKVKPYLCATSLSFGLPWHKDEKQEADRKALPTNPTH